jgi:hypothetical protein
MTTVGTAQSRNIETERARVHGFIYGVLWEADRPGRELTWEDLDAALLDPDAVLWLHFNAANAHAREWLNRCPRLPETSSSATRMRCQRRCLRFGAGIRTSGRSLETSVVNVSMPSGLPQRSRNVLRNGGEDAGRCSGQNTSFAGPLIAYTCYDRSQEEERRFMGSAMTLS